MLCISHSQFYSQPLKTKRKQQYFFRGIPFETFFISLPLCCTCRATALLSLTDNSGRTLQHVKHYRYKMLQDPKEAVVKVGKISSHNSWLLCLQNRQIFQARVSLETVKQHSCVKTLLPCCSLKFQQNQRVCHPPLFC